MGARATAAVDIILTDTIAAVTPAHRVLQLEKIGGGAFGSLRTRWDFICEILDTPMRTPSAHFCV